MKKLTLIIIVLLFTIVLSACSAKSPSTAPLPSEPAQVNTEPSGAALEPSTGTSDGKTLMETRCATCHSVNKVTSWGGSENQWSKLVDRMIAKGASLTADEKTILVQYLAANYK